MAKHLIEAPGRLFCVFSGGGSLFPARLAAVYLPDLHPSDQYLAK